MKNNKKLNRVIALILALMIVFMANSVSAAEISDSTAKEEVVYVNLNADGSVKEINVVNIFDADGDRQIVDYGEYQSLRNMTTEDEINYSKDKVTIDAGAGKLYYEGKLESNVIPWNISIHYFMDGTEYSAGELAGKSGAFRMTADITDNQDCTGSFFDGYALQASVTMDTDKCSNIVAEDATVANVGSDKQLTYTILPGKGAEIDITADVTDFEMDGLAINGIPMNLDIEVDDEELMDQIRELMDAIEDLDQGAGELQNGVSELQSSVKDDLLSGVSKLQNGAADLQNGVLALQDGVTALQNGAGNLQSGADSLDSGIKTLNDGIGQIQSALNSLNSQSDTLTSGSADFKKALGQLNQAVQALPSDGGQLDGLKIAVSNLVTSYDSIDGGISGYTGAVAQINTNYAQITDGAAQLSAGSGELVSGTQALYTATGELLSGVTELYNGTGSLYDGTGELKDGVEELLAGIVELYDGAGELKDGTAELHNKTEGMDAEISDKIDELIESITGGDMELTSFVSEKNTNIESVQFVIQTEEIAMEEAEEPVQEAEESLNLWQKFLNLFGL